MQESRPRPWEQFHLTNIVSNEGEKIIKNEVCIVSNECGNIVKHDIVLLAMMVRTLLRMILYC